LAFSEADAPAVAAKDSGRLALLIRSIITLDSIVSGGIDASSSSAAFRLAFSRFSSSISLRSSRGSSAFALSIVSAMRLDNHDLLLRFEELLGKPAGGVTLARSLDRENSESLSDDIEGKGNLFRNLNASLFHPISFSS
jgi:hypothetical protein